MHRTTGNVKDNGVPCIDNELRVIKLTAIVWLIKDGPYLKIPQTLRIDRYFGNFNQQLIEIAFEVKP